MPRVPCVPAAESRRSDVLQSISNCRAPAQRRPVPRAVHLHGHGVEASRRLAEVDGVERPSMKEHFGSVARPGRTLAEGGRCRRGPPSAGTTKSPPPACSDRRTIVLPVG